MKNKKFSIGILCVVTSSLILNLFMTAKFINLKNEDKGSETRVTSVKDCEKDSKSVDGNSKEISLENYKAVLKDGKYFYELRLEYRRPLSSMVTATCQVVCNVEDRSLYIAGPIPEDTDDLSMANIVPYTPIFMNGEQASLDDLKRHYSNSSITLKE